MRERITKYVESNIPEGIRAEVRYIKGALSGQSPWVTHCYLIENATGKIMGSGEAVCSTKDQPVRKIGRAMAIGRALKEYDQSVLLR